MFLSLRFKEGESSVLSRAPYVQHENGSLEIPEAQPPHSGGYTCVATNHLGKMENHVHLEVKGEGGPGAPD